jgi:hypothetical protein
LGEFSGVLQRVMKEKDIIVSNSKWKLFRLGIGCQLSDLNQGLQSAFVTTGANFLRHDFRECLSLLQRLQHPVDDCG